MTIALATFAGQVLAVAIYFIARVICRPRCIDEDEREWWDDGRIW